MNQAQRLLKAGVLTTLQVEALQRRQALLAKIPPRETRSIAQLAVEMGFSTDGAVSSALNDGSSGHLLAIDVPAALVRKLEIKPLGLSHDEVLHVAALRPLTEKDKEALIDACSRLESVVSTVEVVPTDSDEVLAYLREQADDEHAVARALERFNEAPEEGGVKEILDGLLRESAREKASDVHVFRSQNRLDNSIRYRSSGVLQERHVLSPDAARVLTTFIKNVANMDSTKMNSPQDGRFQWKVGHREIDLRVSSLPTAMGEKLVMRLLDPADRRPLSELYRDSPMILERLMGFTRISPKTPGLLIISGSTNSGKSSTARGLVTEMDRLGLAIYFGEDPVEQVTPCTAQTSVTAGGALSYESLLTSQMRLDPDVLGIGEVRDRMTAEGMVRSVESGHFVMGTLHASSCDETIRRLLNLQSGDLRSVNELTIANHLKAVLNLRLEPRLCSCATEVSIEEVVYSTRVRNRLGAMPGQKVKQKVGCPLCRHAGYLGRVSIPEAVFFGPEPSTKKELLECISGKRDGEITSVSGAEYFARETNVRKLLFTGQIDAKTAASALGEQI